jgi:hypothetical protein
MTLWWGVILLLLAAYPLAVSIDSWITGTENPEIALVLLNINQGEPWQKLVSLNDFSLVYRIVHYQIPRILLFTITLFVVILAIGLMTAEKKTFRIAR